MQDDGSAKSLNSSLEKHWEKIAVGAVLAVLVIYLGAKAFGEGQGATKVIDDARRKLESQRPMDNVAVPPPTSRSLAAPAPATAPVTPKKWTSSHLPPHIADFKIIRDVELSFLFPEIHLDSNSVEVDGAEVTWSLTVLTPEPGVKQTVPKPETFYFVIERRVKGKNWETIGTIKLKDMADPKTIREAKEFKGLRYKDGKTQPKTDYEYRITLGCNDPQYKNKQPTEMTTRIIGPVAVRTLGLFEFSRNFNNIQGDEPDAEPPKAAQVYIKIFKYDPEFGKVEWSGIHKVGEKIGWSLDPDTKTLTSKHKVSTPKRRGRAEVDFDTGAVIKEIKTDQVVLYEYKACAPTPDGCEGPKVRKDQYKVNRVVYIDEDKVEQTFEVPVGMGKRADYLCELHGGVAPHVETPEERAAARETQAQAALDDADRLWKSDKLAEKREAQKKYSSILEKYADTQALKPRKAEIEGRTKEKLK